MSGPVCGGCGATCGYGSDLAVKWRKEDGVPDEPCWGELHCDEVQIGESEWEWSHWCDGHDATYNEIGGAYIPRPTTKNPMFSPQEAE